MKSREVELGSNSRVDRFAAEVFLNSCFFGRCLCDFVPHSSWNSS